MSTDPNLHWDGRQWHRWDGRQWLIHGVQVDSGLAYPKAAQPVYAAAAYTPATAQPAYGYQPQLGPLRINDRSSKPVETIVAWVATFVTVGYLLPWAIAASRGKSNSLSVFLITLLLGWTGVGWIIALVMACGPHQAVWGGQPVNIINAVAVHSVPHPYAPGYQPAAYPPPAYPPPGYQSAAYPPPAYPPPVDRLAQAPDVIGAGPNSTQSLPLDQPTVELPEDPRMY